MSTIFIQRQSGKQVPDTELERYRVPKRTLIEPVRIEPSSIYIALLGLHPNNSSLFSEILNLTLNNLYN